MKGRGHDVTNDRAESALRGGVVIDGHSHVFTRLSPDYPRPVSQLYPAEREAPVEEHLRLMDASGVSRAVLVALHVGDGYTYDCVRAHPERFAGIGGHDPLATDPVDTSLGLIAQWGLKGLRFRILGDSEVSDVAQLASFPLLHEMAARGLVVSFYADRAQMGLLARVLERLPQLTVVLNHLGVPLEGFSVDSLGRPRLAVDLPPPTLSLVEGMASFPNVHVVLSGQYAVSRQAYPYADLADLTNRLCEAFGPGRLLWGSDSPWIVAEPGYPEMLNLVGHHLPRLAPHERAAVLGGNASRLYGFGSG